MKKLAVITLMTFSFSAMALPIAPVVAGAGLLGIGLFSSGCGGKKDEISKLNAKIASLEKENANLLSEISECSATVESKNNAILDLQNSLSDIEESYEECESDYEYIASDFDELESKVSETYAVSFGISSYCNGSSPISVSQAVRDQVADGVRSSVINYLLSNYNSYILINDDFKAAFTDSDYYGNFVKLTTDDSDLWNVVQSAIESGNISQIKFVLTKKDNSESMEYFQETAQNYLDGVVMQVYRNNGYTGPAITSCVQIDYESIDQLL